MSTASPADDQLGATARLTRRADLLLIAVAVGVGLALLSSRVNALDISSLADLQNLLSSSTTGAGSITAIGLAFLIGASMVVLPCGFPSVFMVPAILNSRPRLYQKAALAVLFLGASAALLALAGLVLSYVGDGILSLVSTQRSKMLTSAVLYSLMGPMTLGYALSSLGFLRLPTLQARVAGPRLPRQDRPYPRSFLLGATFGGGMGIACPMPTYYLILGWVVATARSCPGLNVHALWYHYHVPCLSKLSSPKYDLPPEPFGTAYTPGLRQFPVLSGAGRRPLRHAWGHAQTLENGDCTWSHTR